MTNRPAPSSAITPAGIAAFDVDGTLAQVYALKANGADIVRITCNDADAAAGLACR